ncbi:HEWD family protein [Halobacterium salinarum]|uniref:HEWD family protein n=1 Tax=Halobacterium salinarum TaxID=2242 RepID=UPI0025523C0C|nr:HEWD family protein [Halobacterium salinarum]MDL0126882.1 hypothetical protein [Halobacterium salinarum]
MTDLRTPSERVCTRCGRHEHWSEDAHHWRIGDDAGRVHCIHAWDITASFPVVGNDTPATDGSV